MAPPSRSDYGRDKIMFCRLNQWRMEHELDEHGRVKSPGLLRHVENCDTCRNWLHSLGRMDTLLKADAPEVSTEDLNRIIAKVRTSLNYPQQMPKYTPKQPHWIRYGLSAAAILLFAVGLLGLYRIQVQRSRVQALTSLRAFSSNLENQVSPWTNLARTGIDSQMQDMESSVRGAVGFVGGCLPQGLITAHLSQPHIQFENHLKAQKE